MAQALVPSPPPWLLTLTAVHGLQPAVVTVGSQVHVSYHADWLQPRIVAIHGRSPLNEHLTAVRYDAPFQHLRPAPGQNLSRSIPPLPGERDQRWWLVFSQLDNNYEGIWWMRITPQELFHLRFPQDGAMQLNHFSSISFMPVNIASMLRLHQLIGNVEAHAANQPAVSWHQWTAAGPPHTALHDRQP